MRLKRNTVQFAHAVAWESYISTVVGKCFGSLISLAGSVHASEALQLPLDLLMAEQPITLRVVNSQMRD